MCTVPLDLQRRSEQRWAARFQRPVESAVTPKHQPREQDRQLAAPRKGKRKTRRLNPVGSAPAT